MIVQRRRRRRDDAALRPSGGQWLYDTADDDGVCRAARHCSIAEAEQSKAKDGQNSGTQSVTEQVEAKQNEAGSLDCARAPALLASLLAWITTALACLNAPALLTQNEHLIRCYTATTTATAWMCF